MTTEHVDLIMMICLLKVHFTYSLDSDHRSALYHFDEPGSNVLGLRVLQRIMKPGFWSNKLHTIWHVIIYMPCILNLV